MSDAWRSVVDQAYGDEVERFYELDTAIVDQSLAPRSPAWFFDLAESLGLCASWRVLDVGSRDARHLVEAEDRFGCRTVGVEPAPGNLGRLRRRFPGRPVSVARAVGESLPFASDVFDLAWIRDVLSHVERPESVLGECRRVLRPGAALLVHQLFATERLESREAAQLWSVNAVVPTSMDRTRFEDAVAAAGFAVEHREDLGSEWREFEEEQGGRSTTRQLMRLARLLREPDHFRAALGPQLYDLEVGNCLWGVYQMIGKLDAAVYVLRAGT